VVAGRRGHRWLGSEPPWFDAFLVVILLADMVIEGTLAIVGRIRHVARRARRDDPIQRPERQQRESA
jgi:hypothetical protein